MLVGVSLDPRRSFTTLQSVDSGNYEAFVLVLYCQLYLIQPQILTHKQDRVTIITSFCKDSQLLLAAFQRNTPQSVLLGIKQMLALCYYLNR